MLQWNKYIIPLFSLNEYKGKQFIYKFKCTLCGNIIETKIHPTKHIPGNLYMYLPRCEHCFPKNNLLKSSKIEKEFITFCKQYFPNLSENNYDLISPYEVDVYIPEIKLAIEFNGLYYHNNKKKEQGFHLMKTEMCEKLNIRLIHIWEDNWKNNSLNIKQKLIQIFTNKEIINYSQPLDRCWYQYKEIPGYRCTILPPKLIKRDKFLCENCGYLIYKKI